MHKFFLFCLGILLAAGVVAYRHFEAPRFAAWSVSAVSASARAGLSFPEEFQSGTLSEEFSGRRELPSAFSSSTASVSTALSSDRTPALDRLRSALERRSSKERLALLIAKLKVGTPEALQFLDTEVLYEFPEYELLYLPTLKQEASYELLSRFRGSDWTDWRLGAVALNGGSTAARAYVDAVGKVNSDLGPFLETAAMFFHRLYVDSNSGQVFHSSNLLSNLLGAKEPVASQMFPNGINSRQLEDEDFVALLESLRRRFVLARVESRKDDALSRYNLLINTQYNPVNTQIQERLVAMLKVISLKASPKFRARVLELSQESSNLYTMAQYHERLRRTLAECYLMGVLDALDPFAPRKALGFLRESSALFPGLKGQRLLAVEIDRLNSVEQKLRSQNLEPEISEQPVKERSVLTLTRPKTSAGSMLSQIFSWAVIVIAVFILGLIIFVYKRSLSALTQTA